MVNEKQKVAHLDKNAGIALCFHQARRARERNSRRKPNHGYDDTMVGRPAINAGSTCRGFVGQGRWNRDNDEGGNRCRTYQPCIFLCCARRIGAAHQSAPRRGVHPVHSPPLSSQIGGLRTIEPSLRPICLPSI